MPKNVSSVLHFCSAIVVLALNLMAWSVINTKKRELKVLFFSYQIIFFIPIYSQKSVYFTCYLYAASPMLQSCLLLYCVYVYLCFVENLRIYLIEHTVVHIKPQYLVWLRWSYGFANGSLVNTIKRILTTCSITLI